MRSAPVDVGIVPVTSVCADCTPLTKIFRAVPSNVVAICVHVFGASALDAPASRKPPMKTSPVGTFVPVSPPAA